MTSSVFILLLAVPAAANPATMTATLEALRSEAVADPAALTAREGASVRSGRKFDSGFTIQTLAPVEFVQLPGEPRKNPPPSLKEKTPPNKAPSEGANADYYFEGKKPLDGITIYTPVKGQGSTSEGEAPTAKYGKYAMIGGAALIGVGLLLGGAPLVAAALIGGLLIGAGAVLSFLFGKKK